MYSEGKPVIVDPKEKPWRCSSPRPTHPWSPLSSISAAAASVAEEPAVESEVKAKESVVKPKTVGDDANDEPKEQPP